LPGTGTSNVVLGGERESLTLVIQFEKDPEKKKEELELQNVNGTTAKLIFRNWENVLATGLLQPIEIGTFRRRKLFVFLFVRKIGTKADQKNW
jgi:hypothetical protein